MSDTVVLAIPRDARYYSVARLVIGGMAAPLQMSFDSLDDLQLAISSLLDHEVLQPLADVQIRLEVDGGMLRASIGAFVPGCIDDAFGRSEDESGLGLRRLLDTIVDDVVVGPAAAGDGEWITLVKRVKALA